MGGGAGWGALLAQTGLALGAVCLAAYGALRLLQGGARRAAGALEVVARCPLDARRAVVVLRAGERHLLLGLGDGGAPTLLRELTAEEVGAFARAPGPIAAGPSFLERLRARRLAAARPPETSE